MTKQCPACKAQYMIRRISHFYCTSCGAMEQLDCNVKSKAYEHFAWCVTGLNKLFFQESEALRAAKEIGGSATVFEVYK